MAYPLAGPDSRRDNELLSALPAVDRALLQPALHARGFQEGSILWDAGERADRIYFPVSGMISIVVPSKAGPGLEVGTVGREGAAGLHESLGRLPPMTRAIVLNAGTIVSIPSRDFAAALRQRSELAAVVSACNEWLLAQAQQIAVCNTLHSADARLGRWLVRAADATGSDMIMVTQERIAEMLGIRRTTVTLIAQNLQTAGLISYRRGRITIRDRAGLEAAACDCCRRLDRRHWPSVVIGVRPGEPPPGAG